MIKISESAIKTLHLIHNGEIHQVSYDFKRGRIRDCGKSSRSIPKLFRLGYVELAYNVSEPEIGTWYKLAITPLGRKAINSTNC